jgi:hypothetical protein
MANIPAIVLAATLVAATAAAAATHAPQGLKLGAPGEPARAGSRTQASSADRPSSYTLHIGVEGETASHDETIEIASFGWGATNAMQGCRGDLGSGRAIVAGPGVEASEGLYRAAATQKPIAKAVLTARKSGGGAYTITMTDVTVTSAMTSTTSPAEDMAIDFSRASFVAENCSAR